jgi:hypothetical protein
VAVLGVTAAMKVTASPVAEGFSEEASAKLDAAFVTL